MANRSAVPAEVERAILIESGHRCAVCGAGCPLERAHIIPWRESREHRAEDMICLCANCHARADKEMWGEQTLREYKQSPWVMRQFEKADNIPELRVRLHIEIDMEMTRMDGLFVRLLQSGLAGFLEVSPNAVRITSIEEGSVKVTVDLPAIRAEKLLDAYDRNDPELIKYLAPLVLRDICWKTAEDEENFRLRVVCLGAFERLLGASSRKYAFPRLSQAEDNVRLRAICQEVVQRLQKVLTMNAMNGAQELSPQPSRMIAEENVRLRAICQEVVQRLQKALAMNAMDHAQEWSWQPSQWLALENHLFYKVYGEVWPRLLEAATMDAPLAVSTGQSGIRHVTVLTENIVQLGSRVTVVEGDGHLETYHIVAAAEADPSQGLISIESPLGRALMGAEVGQKTVVHAPGGELVFEIVCIAPQSQAHLPVDASLHDTDSTSQ